MIKIKDDFDLDKLIGFNKNPSEVENGKYYYCSVGNKEDTECIWIDTDRILSIQSCDGNHYGNTEIPAVLYNLFKMGIIEEVRK